MLSSIKRLLIGKPLRTEQLHEERLPIWKALPILSSDALSSLAYGTETLLQVFALLGPATYKVVTGYSLPITASIICLLFFLILSYRQVVFQYPGGGGAYVVATENLGWKSGLCAGAALLVDYVLTCAVSVTAGVAAITSAMPDLTPYSVSLDCLFIFIIMVLNLRGVRESGTIFAFPTYLFIIGMILLVTCGLWDIFVMDEHVHPAPFPPLVDPPALTWFVILRAFAGGCTALTGVEAIANATPTFQTPPAKRAARTLSTLGWILGVLLAGISALAYFHTIYPPPPSGGTSVLAQLNEHIFGRGVIFVAIQAATALILVLAANTAFSAFPLLASIMAQDRFMPRMFAQRGDRLNFSNGIIALALVAILLVVGFDGKLDSLISLYAIGVFLAFTLSQAGMVKRWWSQRPRGWFSRCLLNAIGTVMSFAVLIIFAYTKFLEGAWMVVVILPIMVFLFFRVRRHYDDVSEQLRLDLNLEPVGWPREHLIIVPVGGQINSLVMHTLAYAQELQGRIIAVHVTFDVEEGKRVAEDWRSWYPDVRLLVLRSRFRSLINPLIRFIERIQRGPQRHLTVLIPEFIPTRWRHRILHNQSAFLIRFFLLGCRNVVIATVPFRLKPIKEKEKMSPPS